MLKKSLFILLLVVTTGAFATPSGVFYTDVHETVSVGNGTLVTAKSGTGSAMSILGVFGTGNADAQSIAKEAGITQISHIDKHTQSIFFFFVKETFTVYGK